MTVNIFISFRSDDDALRNVQRFKEDLERRIELAELDAKVFLSATSLGSIDRWQDDLKYQLDHCQVFLPLVSPNYFTSDVCSKEWRHFERRMGRTADRHGLLQPILWSPQDCVKLPPEISSIDYGIAGKTPRRTYAERGLQYLMQSKSATYQDILRSIVTLIGNRLDRVTLDLNSRLDEEFSAWERKFDPHKTPGPLEILVHHSSRAALDQIEEFSDDLAKYLGFVGRPGSKVTSVDASALEAAGEWRRDHLDELRRSHVFVPLLARNYSQSEAASRAWWLFEERIKKVNRAKNGHDGSPKFVLPVLWSERSLVFPMLEQEKVLKEVRDTYQIGNSASEGEYARAGLLALQEDRENSSWYIEMMWLFAERISRSFPGGQAPERIMPPAPFDPGMAYSRCGRFFELRRARKRSTARPVSLVRMVAAVDELDPNDFGEREPTARARYYGDDRNGWKPYRGIDQSRTPLIDQAREALREAQRHEDADRDVMEIERAAGIEDALQRAGSSTPIVIVDAFLIGSEERRDALGEFLAKCECEMLVPKNPEDHQVAGIVTEGYVDETKGVAFPAVRDWVGNGRHQLHMPEDHRAFYAAVLGAATADGPLPAFGGGVSA